MLNHALMVIAMMLGAILAMIGGFGVGMFGKRRAPSSSLLLYLPLPMLALLAVGLSVHVRVVSLALLAVVLAIGTYCRRFGPPGFMGGMLAFMGAFLGFFIQDYVPLSEFGWLGAEVADRHRRDDRGALRVLPARPEAAVRRMQRSYAARARGLASEVADLYEATVRSAKIRTADRSADRRLQRQLLRLNEAALLIDAQLSPGGGAGGLERRHAAPAAVRRRGGAGQRRAVRARARQARGSPRRSPRWSGLPLRASATVTFPRSSTRPRRIGGLHCRP